MPRHHLAAELNEWLTRPDASADPVVTDIVGLPAQEWTQFVADYSQPLRQQIARQLIDRAHGFLGSSPKDAVPVSLLAVKLARSVVGSTDAERDAAVALEADAHHEHAYALLFIDDFNEARKAADEATFLYSLVVANARAVEARARRVSVFEHEGSEDGSIGWLIVALMPAARDSDDTRALLKKIAVHGLVLGQILAGQEYLDEGLTLIEQCTNVLLSVCNDPDAYVNGRCISAMVLGERRRLGEALEILRATRTVAATLDNEETLAHLLNNIGYLEYKLFGNTAEAKKCLEEALGIFEDLGKKAHALRPRTALATILMAEGTKAAINRCISELFKCRAWYLESGLTNDAAKVMLKIVRAYVLGGRQADINWSDINHTFGELHPASLRALRHLESVAARHDLTIGDVEDAEDMLRLSLERPSSVQEAG